MRIIKLLSTFVLLINFFSIEGQTFKNLTPIEKEIQIRIKNLKSNLYLEKTLHFFFNKEWDSTLVYTTTELNLLKNDKNLKDFYHFLRGFSLNKKKLFSSAKKELEMVSEDFYFHFYIQMLLGGIELEMKNFESAKNLYEQINTFNQEQINLLNIANIQHNLGIVYFHTGKFDLSEKNLLSSIKKTESNRDTLQLIGSYGDIANLYYIQYRDTQAIPYFLKAYNLAKTTNDFESKQNTALNMAVVEENRKNYIKSLAYRKEFEKWKDSLNNQNRIYETAQLEKKIAVEQKQSEITTLEAENRAKEAERNVFLLSAAVLLLLLGASIYFYRQKVKTNKVISAQKEALDELNATKDKLFSIVSHDLRSSVNAIKTSNKKLITNLESQNKTEIHDTLKQNSAIVNGAYGLLDNLLNWALLQTKKSYFEMTPLHLSIIADHVAFNYKAILEDKQMAFKNSISKKTEVFADQESLKIILRNLLDNAIKFSEADSNIHIYTEEKNDDYIYLMVEDSGIGMDAETKENLLKDTQLLSKKKHEDKLGTGLGLHLVKSMAYKNKGTFSIESELGKGAKIIIGLLKTV